MVAPPSSTSTLGWQGNTGYNNGAGASTSNASGAASGVPLVTGPGIASMPNQPGPSGAPFANTPAGSITSNPQGVPMQPGANGSANGTGSAGSGNAISSPFGNGAIGNRAVLTASNILGISGLISLLVSGIVV